MHDLLYVRAGVQNQILVSICTHAYRQHKYNFDTYVRVSTARQSTAKSWHLRMQIKVGI